MAYLIACDASCWEAGPILPAGEQAEEVVSRRRDALHRFNRKRDLAAGLVEKDINTILSEPEHLVLASGYTWYALLVALPRGTHSLHDAIAWLRTRTAEQRKEALVDFDGTRYTPLFPDVLDDEGEPLPPDQDSVDPVEALGEVVGSHTSWAV